DEALAEIKRSAELDHFARAWGLGEFYFDIRQYDAAIAEIKMQIQARPGIEELHEILAQIYWAKGMYKEWEEESVRSLERRGQKKEAAHMQKVWLHGGAHAIRQEELDGLLSYGGKHYVVPYYLACVAAAAGDKEQTLRGLEGAYRDH